MRRLTGLMTVFVVLALSLYGVMAIATPSAAQSGTSNFTNIKASGDITAGDDLIATDDATIGDALTAADATFSDDLTTVDLFASKKTVVVVTSGGTLTPTGMYQPISSTTAVGTSSIAGVATAGRVLVIVNVGSQTVTFTDTSTLKLAGNAALGQYDNLTLLGDGTNWIQVAKTDN